LLAIENRRARPQRYVKRDYVKATVASRWMVLSGLMVLAFLIYHLAHFTVRVTDPRFALLKADPLNRYDVYSMMVYGFQNYYVSGFYLLGMWLLALHLSHGSSSFFQSLGLNNQKLTAPLARSGRILAWLIFAGYSAIPVAILIGLVKPAQEL
jgi:succinate dehydrogenase / fumarate reductase cytochrome b subunit